MPTVEIKNRWTGEVIYSVEADTIRQAVEAAIAARVSLRAANLRDANLRDADLSAANLSAADLRDADLRDAVLTPIRDDLWAVLSGAPHEVEGLRRALIEGRIDGSTYSGECACLVGTLAHEHGVAYDKLALVKPKESRPAERFFMGINPGDTPETNQVSKLALEWVELWLANMRDAFGAASVEVETK